MRKRLSRIGALLMALVMVLSMSISVFADSTPTSADTGSISVYGVDYEAGITVTAYPIALAIYDASGDFEYDYVALYDAMLNSTDNPVTVSTDRTDFTIADAAVLKTIRSATKVTFSNSTWTYTDGDNDTATYTVGTGIASSYSLSYDDDDTSDTYGAYIASGLPVGSYLIVVSGANTTVYENAVVSVTYGETYDTVAGKVDMVNDGTTWVKKSTPTVEKVVVEDDGSTSHGSTANVGDTVSFRTIINPVPYYSGDSVVFNVVDTLSEGLDLDITSIKVYAGPADGNGNPIIPEDKTSVELTNTTQNTFYVITDGNGGMLDSSDTSFKVDFVVSGTYTLNEIANEGEIVWIEYEAKLTKDAVRVDTDVDANTNDVTLTYDTDSTTTGDEKEDTDKTYTYTFDIDGTIDASITKTVFTKVDSTDVTNVVPLEDATFTLYTNAACTSGHVYSNDVFDGTTTSDENGKFAIYGLEAGTYYLKETSAPSGYTLSNTIYKIVIDATYGSDGKLSEYTITVTDTSTNTAATLDYTVTYNGGSTGSASSSGNGTNIPNTQTSELPSTGGYGTMIFTLIGCAVMIVSAAAYIRCREKKVR